MRPVCGLVTSPKTPAVIFCNSELASHGLEGSSFRSIISVTGALRGTWSLPGQSSFKRLSAILEGATSVLVVCGVSDGAGARDVASPNICTTCPFLGFDRTCTRKVWVHQGAHGPKLCDHSGEPVHYSCSIRFGHPSQSSSQRSQSLNYTRVPGDFLLFDVCCNLNGPWSTQQAQLISMLPTREQEKVCLVPH